MMGMDYRLDFFSWRSRAGMKQWIMTFAVLAGIVALYLSPWILEGKEGLLTWAEFLEKWITAPGTVVKLIAICIVLWLVYRMMWSTQIMLEVNNNYLEYYTGADRSLERYSRPGAALAPRYGRMRFEEIKRLSLDAMLPVDHRPASLILKLESDAEIIELPFGHLGFFKVVKLIKKWAPQAQWDERSRRLLDNNKRIILTWGTEKRILDDYRIALKELIPSLRQRGQFLANFQRTGSRTYAEAFDYLQRNDHLPAPGGAQAQGLRAKQFDAGMRRLVIYSPMGLFTAVFIMLWIWPPHSLVNSLGWALAMSIGTSLLMLGTYLGRRKALLRHVQREGKPSCAEPQDRDKR